MSLVKAHSGQPKYKEDLSFKMSSLLLSAGFQLRGRGRADCIHCEGHSRGTVAFNDEVAFCHRCKWAANTRTLARQLGLLRTDPESLRKFGSEQDERSRQ
jgi:hypothetical protein